MIRKVLFGVVLVIVAVAVLAGVKGLQISSMIKAGQAFEIPPETISSATVREVTWETTLAAIGTVTAVQGVTIQTEIPGVVQRLGFESGQSIRKGQLLVQLDSSAEQAQLEAAQARVELAEANLKRIRELRQQDLVAQSDLDQSEATARQAASEVAGFQVAIAKKSVFAPFGGRLGIREIQLGQFADVGTRVVSIQSLDPVHIDFSLPEQNTSRLRKGMKVRAEVDAFPGRVFEGQLIAISPEVNASTRNVRLQAKFENDDESLLPGMFVKALVVLPDARRLLVVPVTAVLSAPYGDSVFVVGEAVDEKTGKTKTVVTMTTVRVGETRGDLVTIDQGLTAGQRVASAGVFKLRNQSAVVINNQLAPSAEEHPRPADS
jgi:membrane fusion protein (multidrug efflux system)